MTCCFGGTVQGRTSCSECQDDSKIASFNKTDMSANSKPAKDMDVIFFFTDLSAHQGPATRGKPLRTRFNPLHPRQIVAPFNGFQIIHKNLLYPTTKTTRTPTTSTTTNQQ